LTASIDKFMPSNSELILAGDDVCEYDYESKKRARCDPFML